MLHFCVTARHAYTFQEFFDIWGRSLNHKVTILPYEQIVLTKHLPGGVYLFSDLERLLEPELAFVKHLYQRLCSNPNHYKLINNPVVWLNRFDLLRCLYRLGFNKFQAYRIHEIGPHLKFPVFLRYDNDHHANRSPLLYSLEELKSSLEKLPPKKWSKNRLMIVEYCNTSDDQGIFRKYAAMKIDNLLIPLHIYFGNNWMVKYETRIEENAVFIQEENHFLNEFPHHDQVWEIFRLGGLDYGRIDYGVMDGQVQTWEINTNPTILNLRPEEISKERLPGRLKIVKAFLQQFQILEQSVPETEGIKVFPPLETLTWSTLQIFSKVYERYRY